jgi:DNA-binding Lrp family transcriptional regulator
MSLDEIMDNLDRNILQAVQDGIPLSREPFAKIADGLGITEELLLERLNNMKKKGMIRRFSANIDQRRLGINANAVVVWKIPKEKLQIAVEELLACPKISHLYERRILPGKWEYNLYSVVHDYDVESVKRLIEDIAERISVQEYQVLFSKRRFKGTSSRLATRR